jgi:hypothetical protein
MKMLTVRQRILKALSSVLKQVVNGYRLEQGSGTSLSVECGGVATLEVYRKMKITATATNKVEVTDDTTGAVLFASAVVVANTVFFTDNGITLSLRELGLVSGDFVYVHTNKSNTTLKRVFEWIPSKEVVEYPYASIFDSGEQKNDRANDIKDIVLDLDVVLTDKALASSERIDNMYALVGDVENVIANNQRMTDGSSSCLTISMLVKTSDIYVSEGSETFVGAVISIEAKYRHSFFDTRTQV